MALWLTIAASCRGRRRTFVRLIGNRSVCQSTQFANPHDVSRGLSTLRRLGLEAAVKRDTVRATLTCPQRERRPALASPAVGGGRRPVCRRVGPCPPYSKGAPGLCVEPQGSAAHASSRGLSC